MIYNDLDDRLIGTREKGWSWMDCKNQEPHESHVFSSEFFWYGPYRCPGFPQYAGKHREP